MDCKIEGRTPEHTVPDKSNPLDYGLVGLAPGQQKFAHIRANQYLQRVMMDPSSPDMLKALIREQNAVGMMFLGLLLAAYFRDESMRLED